MAVNAKEIKELNKPEELLNSNELKRTKLYLLDIPLPTIKIQHRVKSTIIHDFNIISHY